MFKKVFALLLCVLMLIPCLSACVQRNEDDMGAFITMYLTDEIYNFDPAYANYNNGTRNIVSLMFETLFTLDAEGKVQNSLVNSYKYTEDFEENEFTLQLNLKNTSWSNGLPVTADDVVYAWKRLLNPNNSFEAASLLFDIKNARAVKEGDESIDNLGVEASAQRVVTIFFEAPIDYERFILNLTSIATAPLPESYIEKDPDWAKKSSTMVTSGPFKLGRTQYVDVTDVTFKDDYSQDEYGKVISTGMADYQVKKLAWFYLERNPNYYRNAERDVVDSAVTPYRLLVNCSLTPEEIESEYKAGHLFYIGDIPCSMRADANGFIAQNVQVKDSLSTFVCSLNQNALIDDGGEGTCLFADKNVREALSLVIDREAIRKAVVYAKAATGLVPYGVFETGAGKNATTFRSQATDLIATGANKNKAVEKLNAAGITDPSKYSFTIKVAAYDDVNIVATNMIAEAWKSLGFNVTVQEVETIVNNDVLKAIADEANNKSLDICDDLFVEAITRANYEVITYDYNAFTADAYSVLANFAKSFAGMAVNMSSDNYELNPNRTGYDSEEYNNLMEAVYYVPYFANLDRENDSDFLGIYDTKEEFQAVYDIVKKIYSDNGITPSTNSSDWAAQKAKLLHKAEEMLIADMAIIPVLFNQHAEVINADHLSKIVSNYYVPAVFTKTELKDYLQYTYIDAQGKLVSIFAPFPNPVWEEAGKSYYVEPEKK